MSRDFAVALDRAVHAALPAFSGAIRVRPLGETPWASITFTGARHRVQIELEGAGAVGAAADLIGVIGELEISLSGRIVADVALIAEARRDDGRYACLDVEALTIDDA